MQLDLVALEAEPSPGHVQTPDASGLDADISHAGIPVALEVGAPFPQRQCVVLPQVLLVANLQACVLGLADDPS